MKTGVTQENVNQGNTFESFIKALDSDIQENVVSKGKRFTILTFQSWEVGYQIKKEAEARNIPLPDSLKSFIDILTVVQPETPVDTMEDLVEGLELK